MYNKTPVIRTVYANERNAELFEAKTRRITFNKLTISIVHIYLYTFIPLLIYNTFRYDVCICLHYATLDMTSVNIFTAYP